MALQKLLAPFCLSATLLIPVPALAQVDWKVADVGTVHARYAEAPPVQYYELRRMAYDEGYREGVKEGEKDARRGDRFEYRDEKEFQRADRGYHRQYGDRDRYRELFREGYAAGYSAAYSRLARGGRNDGWYGRPGPYSQRGGYGGWGSSGRYPAGGGYYSPAFDNGAREGYEKGQEDARKNRNYDPRRHSWYRDGDRHYERHYGPRDQYKDIYRQGFLNGYERGYREGNRWRW